MYFLCINAVDGGDLNWVKVGSFVILDGSENYNQSGSTLNAIWPSKLCISI